MRRAILSVSDKSGVVDFARGLADRGFELVSTGGTARALAAAGLPVGPEMSKDPVKADVVLGYDGLARAIRFVR